MAASPGSIAKSARTSKRRASREAEQDRQLRDLLDLCPAALMVVDEDGRLLFHNRRLRELLGYTEAELHLFDSRGYWYDLEQRAQIIKELHARGGQIFDRHVVYKTK